MATTRPTVYIVGADKGGVGKTTVTRALLDYLKDHGVAAKAWDTEPGQGVLKKFFPEITEVVDLTKSDGQMKVFDGLSRDVVTVIDCKAGILSETLQILANIGFLEAVRESKLDVIVLHVMGATKASFEEIKATAALLVGAKHYLVTNHINDTAYYGWDSDAARAVLALANGGVIDIPKLDELAMENVGLESVSYAKFHQDTKYSFVLRGFVRHWLGKVFAAFAKAKVDPAQ